jgi:hypothetical protein
VDLAWIASLSAASLFFGMLFSSESVSKKSFGGESAKHQTDHRNVNHGFTGLSQKLIVLGQSTLSAEPSEGSFHNPPSWKHMKTFLIGSFDDLQIQRVELAQLENPLNEFSGISTICPDEFEAHELLSDQVEQKLGAITILDVGCMNDHSKYQPQSVYEQVPLSAINLLASVISMEPPFSVVLTDWLSMIAALGSASRPSVSRSSVRKAA